MRRGFETCCVGGSVGNVVLVLRGERAVDRIVVAEVVEEEGVERRLGGWRVQPGEMKT